MKKGFTLIELLAVIAIVGIIALVTYPVVEDVINSSEKKTFKLSVDEIVNIVKVDYSEFNRTGEVIYNYDEQNISCDVCTSNINYSGEIEDGNGTITITDGKLSDINIANDYYQAKFDDGKIVVDEK